MGIVKKKVNRKTQVIEVSEDFFSALILSFDNFVLKPPWYSEFLLQSVKKGSHPGNTDWMEVV